MNLSTLRFDSLEGLPEYLYSSEPTWFRESDRFDDLSKTSFVSSIRAVNPVLLDPTWGKKLVSISPETRRVMWKISITNGLRKKDLLLLSFLSFDFEETFGWMVRNKILDKIGKYDEVSKTEVLFALASKSNAFLALSWYFRSFQSLNGFLVQKAEWVILRVKPSPLRERKSKPKTPNFCEYRDHGFLPPADQWIEKDFSGPVHRQIEDVDRQIRTLLEISAGRGVFVPQSLLEELLSERRKLIDSIQILGLEYSVKQ